MAICLPQVASKNIYDFDPRSIPGCVLWLDPSDQRTLTGSSPVTAIADKSGSGAITTSYAGTPTLSTINGVQSLNFNGSSYIRGTWNGTSYTGLNITIFVVATMQDEVCYSAFQVGATNTYSSPYKNTTMGTNVIFNYGSWAVLYNNNIYSLTNGGITGTILGANECVRIDKPQFDTPFMYANRATFVSSFISGTSAGQGNSNVITADLLLQGADVLNTNNGTGNSMTYGWGPSSVYTPNMTDWIIGAGMQGPGSYWKGKIGEIIVFSSSISTSQIKQVEGYLVHKWGLNNNTTNSVASPLSVPGCILWLDAGDPNGTGTRPANGTTLTTWKDKSVSDFPFTSIGSSYNTTAVNGNPGISLSSNYFKYDPGSNQNNWQEVFAVGLWNGGSTFNNYNGFVTGLISNNGGDGAGIIFIGNTGSANFYPIGGTYTTPVLNGTPTYAAIPTIQSPFIVRTFSTTAVNQRGIRFGIDRIFTDRIWQGFISEVICYNTLLSTTQKIGIETYLANKWGITVARLKLPSTHPYISLRTQLRIFQPTDISGCRLWLDAADSSTITLSSGNVTQWRDKSVFGNTMTPYSSFNGATVSTAFQNGLNVLNFSGNGLYRSPASSAVYPLDGYFVIALKDTTTRVDVFGMGATSTDNFNSLTFGEHTARRWHNGSTGFSRTPNCVAPSNETSTSFLLIQWSIANNNFLIRRNGTVLVQTASYTFTLTAGSIFQIGLRYPFYSSGGLIELFRGYLGEIIMFNRQLGDGERQQIEGYLTHKWGLSASLPATHSFKSFPSSTVTRPNFLELAYTPSNNNLFIAKYSSDGSVLWALRHVTPNGVIPRDMATDSSGNMYISSYYDGALTVYSTTGTVATTKANAGSIDGYLAKYSPQGVLLWMARNAATAGNYGVGIAVDLSGNVYLGGTYQPSLTLYNPAETSNIQLAANAGQTDGFLAKYSSEGTPLWVARTAGTSYDSGGISIKTDSVGDVYSLGVNVFGAVTFYNANGTTGGSLSFTGSTTEATWLAKWNSSGTFQWALRFVVNDTNTSIGGLSIDSNANLYVSFAYNATMTLRNTSDAVVATLNNSGSYDAFIASYTSAGAYRWHARIIGTGSSDVVAHTGSSNGDQYVLGWYTGTITIYTSGEASSNTLTNSGSYDVFLIKYSSTGVLQWSTRIASVNNDASYMPTVDPNGNVYVTGRYEGTCTFFNVGGGIGATLSSITAPDIFLAKYSTNGQVIWATRIAGTAADYEGAMAADRNGDVFVSGFYQSSPLTFYGV
jgi:hypothetical protein